MILVAEEEKLPKAEDEAPPEVGDHPFEPRLKWYDLCKHCGLARAAHQSSTIDTRLEMLKDHMERYGKVNHVDPEQSEELTREFLESGMVFDESAHRELETQRLKMGGRVRIGYVGDDVDDDD